MRRLLQFITRGRTLSDAEYIERIRQRVAKHERQRFWLRLFAVVLGLATIGLVILYQQVVDNLGNLWPGMPPGFILGLILGWKVALLMFSAVHFSLVAFV